MIKNKLQFFLWLCITMLAFGILAYVFFLKGHTSTISAKKLNRFRLENEMHESFTLNNFKGKYVFINCWQSWCGPCLQELPMLDSAFQMVDKEKWIFVVITDEDWEKIETTKSINNFQMPFYKSKSSFSANGITAYPLSIILNEKGEIVMQELGLLPYHATGFVNYLKQLHQ